MKILEIKDSKEKREISGKILSSLGEWFEDEEAVEDYVRKSRNLPFFAVEIDGRKIGFISLKEKSPHTLEIFVMGILKEFHRKGYGRALLETVKKWAEERNYEYLEVKTLDESFEDPFYEKTRKFYKSVGFKSLEVLLDVWGPENPCLIISQKIE